MAKIIETHIPSDSLSYARPYVDNLFGKGKTPTLLNGLLESIISSNPNSVITIRTISSRDFNDPKLDFYAD